MRGDEMAERRAQFLRMGAVPFGPGGADVVADHLRDPLRALRPGQKPRAIGRRGGFGDVLMLAQGFDLPLIEPAHVEDVVSGNHGRLPLDLWSAARPAFVVRPVARTCTRILSHKENSDHPASRRGCIAQAGRRRGAAPVCAVRGAGLWMRGETIRGRRPAGEGGGGMSLGDGAEAGAAAWIAADWGTSGLRVWRMRGGAAQEARASADGMGALTPDGFEPALLTLIEDWLPPGRRTLVLVCGMAGARQGWVEAPYVPVPCAPADPAAATPAPCADPRLSVRILPGLSQAAPHADVMRGEETQLAGLLAARPDFDGVVCLPGTHGKWVHVSAGEAVSFLTCMTGELFALLSDASVLRHGLTGAGFEEAAFLEGVEAAMDRPQSFSARLFTIRAEGLLNGLSPDAARARLSGLLIGLELAAAKPWWLGRPVAIIGAPALSARYEAALRAQGAEARAEDGGDLTLRGLIAAHDALQKG